MLAKLIIIANGQSIQSFGYNEANCLIYHISDKLATNLEAIYKVKINSLNKKSKLAYIEYLPNLVGIINLKNSNVQAGSHLLCQLVWLGDEKKLPKFSSEVKLLGKYVIILPHEKDHYFSKNLKSSLTEISAKYYGVGIIFRSSIDYLSDYKPIEDEINFLVKQADTLKSWQQMSIGQLSTHTYKFMQLLRETRLSPTVEIHTNSAKIFDYLMPYLDLWQLDVINLNQSLVANDINAHLNKSYAEFGLEIHQLSGINLIDVNSRNASLNFYQVNYLAIDEIVYQIWLRDLTGIILIDFIKNMSFEQQQKLRTKIERYFASDWRKNQILGFTKAGIFEVIRNK